VKTKDSLHVPSEPITRSRAKVFKEALNGLVMQVLAMVELGDRLEYQEVALIHLIHVQEGPNPSLFESLMNNTYECLSFNVCERFLHSLVLEQTESDLSKIN
jgi:hypothetical protein